MKIAQQLNHIYSVLPEGVQLVAVTKTVSNERILELYRLGHHLFGENKVQELNIKHEALPKDIEWHMVGHLQSNKVKYIAPFVEMIHAVDSLKLLKIINKEAKKNNRSIRCLLQLHIADEETKFGMSIEECRQLLESSEYHAMNHVSVCGLMGMATFTSDREQVRREFRFLKSSFDMIKEHYFHNDPAFCELSMGMSDDFQVAIEEGSTMVRIGSAIFGPR